MSKARIGNLKSVGMAVGLMLIPTLIGTADAQSNQIALTPANVIGNNNTYSDGYNNFNPGNIFDQQTGTVSDNFGQNYWLSGNNPPAGVYITIDLGASYSIADFDLFNTHNGGYYDRGTGDFSIIGGNSVTMDGSNGDVLTGQTYSLASGTLTAPTGDPISAQNFVSNDNTAVRYIEFLPTSAVAAGGSALGYGLNELRVYGTLGVPGTPSVPGVPEPASWAMMIAGFGMIGAGMRSRRKQPTVRYV